MGRVSGAFGVQGWVRVHPYSDDPGNLERYREWLLGVRGDWRSVAVLETAVHGRSLVARIEGVNDRNGAEALKGSDVAIPRAKLPPAAEGEFYWSDLVGLAVVNDVGEALGSVAEVFSNGGQDILRVTGAGAERLIPFVEAFVETVDMEKKRILVDWQLDW
ncbi:MAG: ribosome maturation factor RimM [Burkholderiales bacterium]